ncbi:MAG: HEAT repeat domain-containing protein [Myxococcales bacterium]|nr:HEAT repeat domain-containing protein [Myxococcales bacterium]
MTGRLPLALVAALLVSCSGASTVHPEYSAAEGRAGGEAPDQAPPPEEAIPTGRLPEGVTPLHYTLWLEVVPSRDRFRGRVDIRTRLDAARRVIWLHGQDLNVTEVEILPEGQEPVSARYEQVDESGVAVLRLDSEVGPGEVEISITYDAPFDRQLKGLYRVDTGGDSYAFTQFEATSARLAFPCFDEPRFKTPFDVTLAVSPDHEAIANTTPADTRTVDGMKEVRFAETLPLPTYLVAMAVGPLDVVEHAPLPPNAVRTRPLPFRGVAARGRGAQLAYALEHTAPLVAYLEEYFGIEYPYDKLDIIAVPDFASGAMENAGAITFRETLLLLDATSAPEDQRRGFAYVMAHELAHQWFGDLVTCQDWSQGWLNESWATFMEAVWWEHDRSEQDAIWYRHQTMGDYLGEFNGRYRRALVSYRFRDPLDVFDRHLYQKGSCVLWTLRATLGADAFWTGVKQYLHDNAHRAVHSRDFQRALETATGENLDGFFQQWVDAPAHPALSIKLSEESGLLVCEIEQTQTGEGVPEAYRFPLVVEVLTSTGTHRVKLPIAERKRAWALPVDGRITRVRIDPGLNVLATHTWKGPMAWFVDALQDDDPVIVSRAAATLIDEGSAAALDAVRSAMEVHPFWGVRADIAGKLGARGGDDDQAALIDRLEIDGDPRVRRAAAEALGAFRNTTAADALLGVLEEEVTTWQLTGAALKALGTTRDSRAAEALREHLATPSWADTLPSRALVGLAATRDAAVLDTLVEHTQLTHGDRVRAAAAGALGSLATHVDDVKTTAVERLVDMLKEPGFRARIAAIAALGAIGDTRALGALGRMHRSAADGRTRRMAYEASLRIRRSQEDGKAMEDLQLALESLKEENADLRSRIEKLERAGT